MTVRLIFVSICNRFVPRFYMYKMIQNPTAVALWSDRTPGEVATHNGQTTTCRVIVKWTSVMREVYISTFKKVYHRRSHSCDASDSLRVICRSG
jgi:hypothetical protein